MAKTWVPASPFDSEEESLDDWAEEAEEAEEAVDLAEKAEDLAEEAEDLAEEPSDEFAEELANDPELLPDCASLSSVVEETADVIDPKLDSWAVIESMRAASELSREVS